jgi:hypothetical protein
VCEWLRIAYLQTMHAENPTLGPPYAGPVSSRRPYGAHRFDVYSLKAGRRATIFGLHSFRIWLRLEVDPGVTRLCERPIVIRDGPARVVDFWASTTTSSKFILLLRNGETAALRAEKPLFPAFQAWAASCGCGFDLLEIPDPTPSELIWQDNWTQILQHIGSYRGGLTPESLTRLSSSLSLRCSIRDALGALPGADPDLIRAGIFALVHRGTHRLIDIECRRLSDDLEVEPA